MLEITTSYHIKNCKSFNEIEILIAKQISLQKGMETQLLQITTQASDLLNRLGILINKILNRTSLQILYNRGHTQMKIFKLLKTSKIKNPKQNLIRKPYHIVHLINF
ncbi:unnamed protein product [Paramecium octaurelia]|uniref:Uncharacterized protein n=1 Tax=Paramecium octaurelia TaxID=43137 RepID=A0A8S1S9K9_PAROT|nr:unnamed protein product [Paramecium octaurelia]